MESHEVIKEAFGKVSPKEISDKMGLSLSLVYKWAEPSAETGSGSRNPLDRVKELIELSKEPRIVQWLCQQAGGFFVQNPRQEDAPVKGMVPATNELVQQFAELLNVITQAANDNSITQEEASRIRKVWEDLKGYTEHFVRCCEHGDFQQIRSK